MVEINMQMPEKCGLCPCFHHENPMYCQAVKADKNKKIVNPYGSPRPEWCPLKEQKAKTVIKIAKRFNDCDLTGFCPFCSRPLIKDWAEKYCGYCGNPVLWKGR